MRKSHHWVHLTDEGKRMYGHVFPDGIVPVTVMIPTSAKLGGKVRSMFKVDLKQLQKNQIDQLVELMAERCHAPKEVVLKQIQKDGFIPLRENLTCGSGTDQMGLFI